MSLNDVQQIFDDQPLVAGLSKRVGSHVIPWLAIAGYELGGLLIQLPITAQEFQRHDGKCGATHADIHLNGPVLVASVILPDRHEVHSYVSNYIASYKFLADPLCQLDKIGGVVGFGRKLTSCVDLAIEHLLMGRKYPHPTVGIQKSLTRRRRLRIWCSFDKELANPTQGLKLGVIPLPRQSWGHKLERIVQSVADGLQAFDVRLLDAFDELIINSQDGVALAAERIIQLHHHLPGCRTAL
mmetsp:Transcript_9417/g.17428  ORF Transcript_9417/g.17428 Transcript_9417/m.17428 type:complete len:241 (-) Transcript_9417:991-1713(-)